MRTPSQAGFRRLLPLLRPHLRQLTWGAFCMVVFVSSQLVLMSLMGRLLPDVGSGDLQRILPVIGLVLLVFAIQKIAQFGQDSLLAGAGLAGQPVSSARPISTFATGAARCLGKNVVGRPYLSTH